MERQRRIIFFFFFIDQTIAPITRNFFSIARRSYRKLYLPKRSCIYSDPRRPQSHKSWLNSSSYPRDTRILPMKGQGESLLEQLRFWISIAMKLHVLENDAICRLLIYVEEIITAAIQTIVLERINCIAKMIADRSISASNRLQKYI